MSPRGKFPKATSSRVHRKIESAFVERRSNLRSIAARAGEDEAEDAIQDAFVTIIEEVRRREVRALDKLVSRVVRFAAINRFRRRKTRMDYARANAGENAVNSAADPERALMGAQRLQRVLATIEAMPPRRREVFLMHRVDEMTYPQIARRIGTSVKAVEKHMHLAMRQLSDADD